MLCKNCSKNEGTIKYMDANICPACCEKLKEIQKTKLSIKPVLSLSQINDLIFDIASSIQYKFISDEEAVKRMYELLHSMDTSNIVIDKSRSLDKDVSNINSSAKTV